MSTIFTNLYFATGYFRAIDHESLISLHSPIFKKTPKKRIWDTGLKASMHGSICTHMYTYRPPFYDIYRRSCFATCTRMFRLYRTINLLSKNKSNTLSWKIHQRKTFNRRFIRPYFVMLGYWVLIKNLWWLFLRQTTGSDPGSGQESKWLISHA